MGKRIFAWLGAMLFLGAACFMGCKHQPQPIVPNGNFPPRVAAILLNKCAISGCHNAASHQNADGLLLDTWEHLFQGGNNGAAVIAYSPMYSPLLYVTNTDSSLGFVRLPTMPYSTPDRVMPHLSKAEYEVLHDWIAQGAPDAGGNIPFASNPDTRQKIYLTMTGNDIMGVIDAKSKMVMRYFPIGANPVDIESAHDVCFSNSGQYGYVIFYAGNYIQKIDANTDHVISQVDMSGVTGPSGSKWSILLNDPASDTAIAATNWLGFGGFSVINADAMAVDYYVGGLSFSNPHGIESNPSFDTFFIASQFGNVVYRYCNSPKSYKTIPIKGSSTTYTSAPGTPDPHQLQMLPDYSKFYVSCENSNEVRVVDAHSCAVLDSIPVGIYPQEFAICESKHWMFVTCMYDSSAGVLPGRKGSVYVIDYTTDKVVHILYGDFYEPHDVCVDEQDGLVYVCSTNLDGTAHHASPGGKPGWYTVYDLNTLQPDPRRFEVLVDPYAIANRY